MSTEPVPEISCCLCGNCQMYILALQKRIEMLERFMVVQQMYLPVNPALKELTAADLDKWFSDVFKEDKT